MNRDEALNVCTVMATAWPYPEWEEGRLELWVAALADEDADAAHEAVVQAVRELDRAPSVAWLLEAMRAASTAQQFGLPESSETPTPRDVSLQRLSEAREAMSAALAAASSGEGKG